MELDENLKQMLLRETKVLQAEIYALYEELDRKTGLHGKDVPVEFGFATDVLGSYTQPQSGEREHFYFSLLFIGYAVKHPLSKEDRRDLFRHEYAHYMQYNMKIPKEYQWQPGIHGSAWKYCCSIVGAAPSPYYRAGEALQKHDYEKKLKNPIHDKTIPMRDRYRRERNYRQEKDREIRYTIGDRVEHPKFGEGLVEQIEQMTGSVRLHIRFGEELKKIDQKWLVKTGYKQNNTGKART